MPTSHAPRARTTRRSVATGLAVGLMAIVMVALDPGSSWAAESRASAGTDETTLREVRRECISTTGVRESDAATVRCVSRLAPPNGSSAASFDLSRLLSSCLYYAGLDHPDQMYPSDEDTYDDYVNDCLGL